MKILLSVFGVFFSLVMVWHFATRKYLNPYQLFFLFGGKGSGKSSRCVQLGDLHMKRNWYVYTNMKEFHMPGLRHIDIQHVGDFVPPGNSCLLLDEAGMIWDARDFKKFKPSVRDFFILQRHYRVKVYLVSQSYNVDKKLRDLTDGMFLHVKIARVFSIGKRIAKKTVLTESVGDQESRISENLVMLPFWYWTLTYIPKWARYFDSHNIPDLPELPYTTDPDSCIPERKNKIKSLLKKASAPLRQLIVRHSPESE